ncbi:hypothetical protein XENORESO_017776, partial [Xenotaenia resolanae]
QHIFELPASHQLFHWFFMYTLFLRPVSWGVCQPCIHFQAPPAYLNLTSDLRVPPTAFREK